MWESRRVRRVVLTAAALIALVGVPTPFAHTLPYYVGVKAIQARVRQASRKISGSSYKVGPCYRSSPHRVTCGYRISRGGAVCFANMSAFYPSAYSNKIFTQSGRLRCT
jgi:hypothetical protein